MSDAVSPLGQLVARSADTADLHAPVPTLLLELQTLLGTLTATVAAGTGRGRTPFRPGSDWSSRLGELAYGLYLLADQTGCDLEAAVARTANSVSARTPPSARAEAEWPLPPEE